MRFSLQVYYAVCGVFDLAYNGFDQPVQARVVGERQKIPTRYLEQIFQRLRRARIVRGKRGPGGGYVLARPPEEISIRHVIEAVEGSLVESAIPRSTSRSGSRAGSKGSGPAASGDRILDVDDPLAGEVADALTEDAYRPDFLWPDLARRMTEALDGITMADLCRQATSESVSRAPDEAYSYEI